MKKFTQFFRIHTLVFFLLFGLGAFAQIGVGTITPAPGSIFDVTSTNKGVLVPRVDIANLATIAPVTGGATDGLLVWNTRVATGVGYHYWSVSAGRWVPLIPATATSDDWSILGNNNIANATNFLGTINNRDINVRTTNLERMRVQGNGQITVGFGATAANAGDQFSAVGTYAVNGYAGGTGTGVYGQNNSGSGNGVWGFNTSTGNGVYGLATGTGIGVRGEAITTIASLGISNSQVGVQGQSTSSSGVVGLGAVFGTAGQITNATGIGAFGNATTSGRGVQGQSATGDGVLGFSGGAGDGVYGESATGNGVFGYTNNASDAIHAEQDGNGNAVDAVNYGNGVAVYAENFLWTDYAVHAVDGIASVYADNTLIGFDGVVGLTDDTISNGIWGINENATGTAILGGSNGLNVFSGATGSGVAGSGTKNGIFGYAGASLATVTANRGNAAGLFTLDTDSNPATNGTNNGTRASARIAGFDNVSPNGVLAAQNSYFGGYFVGGNHDIATGNPSYAYAGMKWNSNNNGINGTNYKIIGNGTNSTIIKDKTNTPRILFSPEAPEILFEDYGTGKLVNGVAQITIDPILKDAIYVDEKHPLKVFIQLEGDCNGVYVTNKSANGFMVKELANGTSNVAFSYHIVANRADEIDANGEVASKHVGLRFPVGPGLLKEQPLSARKEGDNKVGKDLSSKQRPERKAKERVKVDETIKEVEVKNHDIEKTKEDKELTKEELEAISKKANVSSGSSNEE